mgnify:CR=1 FL=1
MEAWNWANDPTQYETDMASFGDRVKYLTLEWLLVSGTTLSTG